MGGLKKKIAVVATAFLCGGVLYAAPAAAAAAGDNYAKSWESWGGAKWNGYVQIRASYDDGGRHAKQGYHRFQREAGPTLDTGRMYTSTASLHLLLGCDRPGLTDRPAVGPRPYGLGPDSRGTRQ